MGGRALVVGLRIGRRSASRPISWVLCSGDRHRARSPRSPTATWPYPALTSPAGPPRPWRSARGPPARVAGGCSRKRRRGEPRQLEVPDQRAPCRRFTAPVWAAHVCLERLYGGRRGRAVHAVDRSRRPRFSRARAGAPDCRRRAGPDGHERGPGRAIDDAARRQPRLAWKAWTAASVAAPNSPSSGTTIVTAPVVTPRSAPPRSRPGGSGTAPAAPPTSVPAIAETLGRIGGRALTAGWPPPGPTMATAATSASGEGEPAGGRSMHPGERPAAHAPRCSLPDGTAGGRRGATGWAARRPRRAGRQPA